MQYQTLLTLLGYSSKHPPLAALLSRYHQLEGDWLIVSPIHWQASHNDAMIEACGNELGLSDEESRQWFAALEAFLAHDKVKLHYHDAYTWLIQFAQCPAIHTRPVSLLLHQPLMQQIHEMDNTLFWSRLMTEIQMLFSHHPLNKMRSDRNSVNGVWIWGGGKINGTRAWLASFLVKILEIKT